MADDKHEALAPEDQVDRMEERSDALGEQIDDTRQEWENKKHDPNVPGAAGNPDLAERELPPEMDKITPGD